MWIFLTASVEEESVSSYFSLGIVPHIDVFLMCSWREVSPASSYSNSILPPIVIHLKGLGVGNKYFYKFKEKDLKMSHSVFAVTR